MRIEFWSTFSIVMMLVCLWVGQKEQTRLLKQISLDIQESVIEITPLIYVGEEVEVE